MADDDGAPEIAWYFDTVSPFSYLASWVAGVSKATTGADPGRGLAMSAVPACGALATQEPPRCRTRRPERKSAAGRRGYLR